MIGGVPLLACLLAIFLYIFYADWKVIISKHTDDDIKTLTTYLLLAEIGFAVVVCFSPIPSSAWLIFAVLIASQLAVLTDDKAWLQIKLYKWPLYILGALLIVYAATFLASEIILYQGMYDMQNGPTNHIKARNYARISSYLYPGEYMSSYNYIQQNIYLNGKARAEDSRRQIASYIKSYSSVPAAKWKISDLYDALYSETNNDADLESLIYYRTDELKSNPSASNIALSLAIIYNDNGGTHQAKEVIHNALESPGIDNPRILWTFLAKLEEEDGSNSTTVIADLRTAYLLDTTNIQLKHILVSSRKNPAVAISYVRGVY